MNDTSKSNDYGFKLKSHQIVNGNALDILQSFPKNTIDLVITDPPFYLLNKKNLKFKNRANIVQNTEFDDFQSYEDFMKFTQRWCSLISSIVKPNSSVYIFFGAQYISDLMRIYLELGFKYKGIIVWHKTNPVPKIRKSGYLSSTELILYMTKGDPHFNFLGQNKMHNFIETPLCMRPERLRDESPTINKDRKFPSLHPTQKPMKVIEKLIKVSSIPGDIILDPFTGTGTTNVVAKKLGRYSIGIEANEKYYNAAKKRLDETEFNIIRSETQSELDTFVK